MLEQTKQKNAHLSKHRSTHLYEVVAFGHGSENVRCFYGTRVVRLKTTCKSNKIRAWLYGNWKNQNVN